MEVRTTRAVFIAPVFLVWIVFFSVAQSEERSRAVEHFRELVPKKMRFLIRVDPHHLTEEQVKEKLGGPDRTVVDSWYYHLLRDEDSLLLTFKDGQLTFFRYRFVQTKETRKSLRSRPWWKRFLQECRMEAVPKLGVSQGDFMIPEFPSEIDQWRVVFRHNLKESLYALEWRY